MEEQPKLNLDMIEAEKQKLAHLIRPAIEQFVKAVGIPPAIHISKSQQSTETRCGTVWSEAEVKISITVNI